MTGTKPLTFKEVDGLAFAASINELDEELAPVSYTPQTLGPLLELLHLSAGNRLPKHPEGKNWVAKNGSAPLITALNENREFWTDYPDHRMGFIRAKRSGPNADARFLSFLMNASTAARDIAGLPGTVPRQLAAAMEEMENNIHEHSDAPETGLVAFRAAAGVFEFVVADRGIGMLESLRRGSEFSTLPDSGKALEAALTDGTSRFGKSSQRGHGFRPIFLGLSSLYGTLRFRSGDHALIMDGTSPTLSTAQLRQKPYLDGFFASIRCQSAPSAK